MLTELARVIFEQGKDAAARFLLDSGAGEELYRAFSNTAHLLMSLDRVDDIKAMLYSHLRFMPQFAALSQDLEAGLPRPFLVAAHPLADTPHPALLRTLSGHTDDVTGCAISPDGSFVVSSSRDETLKIWDTITGLELRTLRGHKDWVTDCAISPNGSTIISASQDGTIRLWDVATGEERLRVKRHKWFKNPCALGRDYIVAATEDGAIRVSEARTGGRLFTLPGHGDRSQITHVATDDRIIVAASNDTTIHVWDISTQSELFALKGHKRRVNACAIGENTLVSASLDETVKVWDRVTGEERLTLTGHHGEVTSCAIDGERVVSASWDGVIKVWNTFTGVELATLTGHTHRINGCALRGDRIASASSDGTVRVWDAAYRSAVPGDCQPGEIRCCAIHPAGEWAVSGSNLGAITVWDMASGRPLHRFTDPTDHLSCCAIDGDTVIYGLDHRLKGWDATMRRERFAVDGPSDARINACAACEGSVVTGWSDGTLRFFESATGTHNIDWNLHQGSIESCAFEGDTIVSASVDKTVKVWRFGHEHALALHGHSDAIRCCAVHNDLIVTGSRSGALQIWSRNGGFLLRQLAGHNDDVRGCAINPAGDFIVSVSRDGIIKVWDTQTADCLTSLAFSGRLYACAINGPHILASGSSGVYFLDLRR